MKNTLLAIGVTIALILGIIGATKNTDSPSQATVDNVGAVSSPDLNSRYFSVGGIRRWTAKTDDLTSATTTICALQSPVATSTLVSAGIRLTTSSTTASTLTLAKAATRYATTTVFATSSVAANAQVTAVAATTTSVGDNIAQSITDRTFGPSQWFVVGMQGNIGTFSPAGVCQATWEQI